MTSSDPNGALSLVELRHQLHRIAERSNEEERTAALVASQLSATGPDQVVERLGGYGVLAVYDGVAPGPTVLVRSDMDALPIAEHLRIEHGSLDADTSHKCGHDGHMASLVGVARALGSSRPPRGRVVVLFQPAEETGEGAARVLADERFEPYLPDCAIAVHNLPGRPLGEVVVREGPFASASQGMIVELTGVSAHAAEPHTGISPVAAAATIAQSIQAAPQRAAALDECVQATVVGLQVGGPAFGTSPADGKVMATLRAHTEASMRKLTDYCEKLARGIADAHGLRSEISWTDVFPATHNAPAVARTIARAAEDAGFSVRRPDAPFPWSEDFGHFTSRVPGALIGLGSGEHQPALHHSDYDFPDELIELGTRLFLACLPPLLE